MTLLLNCSRILLQVEAPNLNYMKGQLGEVAETRSFEETTHGPTTSVQTTQPTPASEFLLAPEGV